MITHRHRTAPIPPNLGRIRRTLAGTRLPDRRPEGTQAAVALVLAGEAADLNVCLIRRAEHELDRWSGHVALPGGRIDAVDRSARPSVKPWRRSVYGSTAPRTWGRSRSSPFARGANPPICRSPHLCSTWGKRSNSSPLATRWPRRSGCRSDTCSTPATPPTGPPPAAAHFTGRDIANIVDSAWAQQVTLIEAAKTSNVPVCVSQSRVIEALNADDPKARGKVTMLLQRYGVEVILRVSA